MGGWGSGPPRRWRGTVEGVLRLDVLRLNREGCLAPGWSGSWRWTWGEGWSGEKREASIGITSTGDSLILAYTSTPHGGEPKEMEYNVPIERTPCGAGTFRGSRPWFRCPEIAWGCGRRCRFLYQDGGFYACRSCAKLTYRTRRAHRNPSEEARAAGVSVWGDAMNPLTNWRKDPIRRTLYRLRRARNPQKVERLDRRWRRLRALMEADAEHLQRMVSRLKSL